MMKKEIERVVNQFEPENIHIGVLGSHSALEIASGARQEGFQTVVVCQKGREKTYTRYYKNLFDHVILLDKFQDIIKPESLQKLNALQTVFVPNRSFSVYAGYENIEEKFTVPLMGNRYMLRTEERNTPRNQHYLLQKAGILTPKTFQSPEEIDRLAIVKVSEKERAIEEYIVGAKFNANFFWSPLSDELDLLGFDKRVQTDLDGVLDLPATEQLELNIPTQNIEIGHMGVTMRESQLEMIFEAGEKFVNTCKKEYPPGIVGLFALQGAVTKDLKFYVFDVSPRVPGCPCVEPTSPYMKYKYGFEVGPGRRVAMEIKRAVKAGKLADVVT